MAWQSWKREKLAVHYTDVLVSLFHFNSKVTFVFPVSPFYSRCPSANHLSTWLQQALAPRPRHWPSYTLQPADGKRQRKCLAPERLGSQP